MENSKNLWHGVYAENKEDQGAACLCLICLAHGMSVPLWEMRSYLKWSRIRGCSEHDLLTAAKKLGLEGQGYSLQASDLSKLPMPCIVRWAGNRFVVIRKIDKGMVYLEDPVLGQRLVLKDELEQCFGGVAITFKPTEEFSLISGKFQNLAALGDLEDKSRENQGVAVLSVILEYFGKTVPMEELRNGNFQKEDQYSAAEIMRGAKKYGLECHGYKKTAEAVMEMQAPMLIHWCGRQLFYYEGICGNMICIHDPYLGRRLVSVEEFKACFSGIVLTFKPAEKLPAEDRTESPADSPCEGKKYASALLSMLMEHYGKQISPEKLMEGNFPDGENYSAGDLKRTAEKFGLQCHGYKREPDELLKMDMPVIIHWNFNTFEILEGVQEDMIVLNDPLRGRHLVSREELDRSFTGVALTFRPTEAF